MSQRFPGDWQIKVTTISLLIKGFFTYPILHPQTFPVTRGSMVDEEGGRKNDEEATCLYQSETKRNTFEQSNVL